MSISSPISPNSPSSSPLNITWSPTPEHAVAAAAASASATAAEILPISTSKDGEGKIQGAARVLTAIAQYQFSDETNMRNTHVLRGDRRVIDNPGLDHDDDDYLVANITTINGIAVLMLGTSDERDELPPAYTGIGLSYLGDRIDTVSEIINHLVNEGATQFKAVIVGMGEVNDELITSITNLFNEISHEIATYENPYEIDFTSAISKIAFELLGMEIMLNQDGDVHVSYEHHMTELLQPFLQPDRSALDTFLKSDSSQTADLLSKIHVIIEHNQYPSPDIKSIFIGNASYFASTLMAKKIPEVPLPRERSLNDEKEKVNRGEIIR